MHKTAKIEGSFKTKENVKKDKRSPKKKMKSTKSGNTTQKPGSRWTEEDKFILLQALKRYGHSDKEKLYPLLPNKTPAAIRTKISKIIKAAKDSRQKGANTAVTKEIPALEEKELKISYIHKWLNSHLFTMKNCTISRALYYISLFEEHPPVSTLNMCDYRSIYYYLYCLSLGQVPPELTTESEKVLFSIVLEFIENEPSKEELNNYKEEIYEQIFTKVKQDKNKRQYPGKRKVLGSIYKW